MPDTTASRRRRYIAGVALGVWVLYTGFVLVNTLVVGPTTPAPFAGTSNWLYLQDVLDIIAVAAIIAAGAAMLDHLLARDQAVQSATLSGMARVTVLAQRIAETAEFHERVPVEQPEPTSNEARPPPAVAELAATFNAMLARLETAFEVQRRLLADTSHELRNPLTVLRTNLALLQREDVDLQMRLEAAREAEEEAARLGRLMEDLLLLARGDAGDFLARRPTRLNALLADVAEEAAEAGTGHQVELADCPAAVVLGDPERLRQVLRNVVGNALQHTPAGTRVRLSLACTDGVAEVVVRDDGPGIAAVHLPRVFDRFYRVDAARSRATPSGGGATSGAGLGLAIVKHLVEAHGGSVALDSAPAQGTAVRVRLPLAEQ